MTQPVEPPSQPVPPDTPGDSSDTDSSMPLKRCVQLLFVHKTLFVRPVPEGWTQINNLKTRRVEDRRSKRAVMGNRSFWKLKSREKYLFSETFLESEQNK
jgi:hypothetical protein